MFLMQGTFLQKVGDNVRNFFKDPTKIQSTHDSTIAMYKRRVEILNQMTAYAEKETANLKKTMAIRETPEYKEYFGKAMEKYDIFRVNAEYDVYIGPGKVPPELGKEGDLARQAREKIHNYAMTLNDEQKAQLAMNLANLYLFSYVSGDRGEDYARARIIVKPEILEFLTTKDGFRIDLVLDKLTEKAAPFLK
jgi:hypothetical protein